MTAQVGSSGEDCIEEDPILSLNDCSVVAQQLDCLLEVRTGQADAAVIDMTMAVSYCAEGTAYDMLLMIPDLTLADEENAIAFRKDSDFVEKVNEATAELYTEGLMKELADKYAVILFE